MDKDSVLGIILSHLNALKHVNCSKWYRNVRGGWLVEMKFTIAHAARAMLVGVSLCSSLVALAIIDLLLF